MDTKGSKLAYDAYRAAFNNVDSNGTEMKEFEDATEEHKKAFNLVFAVIMEHTKLSVAQNQIEQSISDRLKQLKEGKKN